MAATVACPRCGRPEAPALARPPVPSALGKELQTRVCADCWAEWQKAEVMVINELRLNFMDPQSMEILNRQMREFLFLDAPGPGAAGGQPPGTPS